MNEGQSNGSHYSIGKHIRHADRDYFEITNITERRSILPLSDDKYDEICLGSEVEFCKRYLMWARPEARKRLLQIRDELELTMPEIWLLVLIGVIAPFRDTIRIHANRHDHLLAWPLLVGSAIVGLITISRVLLRAENGQAAVMDLVLYVALYASVALVVYRGLIWPYQRLRGLVPSP